MIQAPLARLSSALLVSPALSWQFRKDGCVWIIDKVRLSGKLVSIEKHQTSNLEWNCICTNCLLLKRDLCRGRGKPHSVQFGAAKGQTQRQQPAWRWGIHTWLLLEDRHGGMVWTVWCTWNQGQFRVWHTLHAVAPGPGEMNQNRQVTVLHPVWHEDVWGRLALHVSQEKHTGMSWWTVTFIYCPKKNWIGLHKCTSYLLHWKIWCVRDGLLRHGSAQLSGLQKWSLVCKFGKSNYGNSFCENIQLWGWRCVQIHEHQTKDIFGIKEKNMVPQFYNHKISYVMFFTKHRVSSSPLPFAGLTRRISAFAQWILLCWFCDHRPCRLQAGNSEKYETAALNATHNC